MNVTIETLPTGGYNVIHGDKYTGCLSYGEMPHTRIRRLVDAALFKDFLTQSLTDEE